MLTQKSLTGRDVAMAPPKIAAFLDEFPWISKFIDNCPISSTYVSMIESDLLNYTPNKSDEEGVEEIWLLDGKGNLVSAIMSRNVTRRRFLRKPVIVSEQYEVVGFVEHDSTIIEKLNEFGSLTIQRIRFVLSYDQINEAVIVYKIPGNLSMAEWLTHQNDVEKIALRKDIAGIDSVNDTT